MAEDRGAGRPPDPRTPLPRRSDAERKGPEADAYAAAGIDRAAAPA